MIIEHGMSRPNEEQRAIYRELAALPDYAFEQGDSFEPTEEEVQP